MSEADEMASMVARVIPRLTPRDRYKLIESADRGHAAGDRTRLSRLAREGCLTHPTKSHYDVARAQVTDLGYAVAKELEKK